MSIETQIQALEALAVIDDALGKLEADLVEEQAALLQKREQLEHLESKIATVQGSVREMERMRNELISEIRQMSVQMDMSRDKLGRCRTEREANAAQREVEELRKLYRDREFEAQKINGLIEQARGDLDKTEAERNNLSLEMGSSAGAVETRLGQLGRETAEHRARRESAAKAVPPVLYRRYETIRKRRGSAICHTEKGGTCSACHISLPPMMFQTLRRASQFDQCPNCNRIIYFRADAPLSDAPKEPSEPSKEDNG